MNTDQIINAIQSLLKIGGAFLAARGTVTGEQWQQITGAATMLLGLWASHKSNETATPTAANASQPSQLSIVKALLLCVGLSALVAGCAGLQSKLDPALPGQPMPAPFIAFTNGSAYLLGHKATSNQVYAASLGATRVGISALLVEEPGATNYVEDAKAVFESAATGGSFNVTNLTAQLNSIGLGEGQTIVTTLGTTAVSLIGVYVQPLISSDTNSAPYVQAALLGISQGL